MLGPWRDRVEHVALGGDRTAVARVLEARADLAWLQPLALERFFDVPSRACVCSRRCRTSSTPRRWSRSRSNRSGGRRSRRRAESLSRLSTSGCCRARRGRPSRTAPVPRPWTTRTSRGPASAASSTNDADGLARLLRALAAHVELVGDVAARGRDDAHRRLGSSGSRRVRDGTQPRERDAQRDGRAGPTTSASSPSIAAIVPRTPERRRLDRVAGRERRRSAAAARRARAAPAPPARRASEAAPSRRSRSRSARARPVRRRACARAGGRRGSPRAAPRAPRAPSARSRCGLRDRALALAPPPRRAPPRSRPRAPRSRARAPRAQPAGLARARRAAASRSSAAARSAASASASSSAIRSRSGATRPRASATTAASRPSRSAVCSACEVPGRPSAMR